MTGDDIAANATAFFGEPLDEAGAIGGFAARLGQRLAHFSGQDPGQILGVLAHPYLPFEPIAQVHVAHSLCAP